MGVTLRESLDITVAAYLEHPERCLVYFGPEFLYFPVCSIHVGLSVVIKMTQVFLKGYICTIFVSFLA